MKANKDRGRGTSVGFTGQYIRNQDQEDTAEFLNTVCKEHENYEGKEFGNPFEQIVYWATHSGWRYCQSGSQSGNEPILKLSHFNSIVANILKQHQIDFNHIKENLSVIEDNKWEDIWDEYKSSKMFGSIGKTFYDFVKENYLAPEKK